MSWRRRGWISVRLRAPGSWGTSAATRGSSARSSPRWTGNSPGPGRPRLRSAKHLSPRRPAGTPSPRRITPRRWKSLDPPLKAIAIGPGSADGVPTRQGETPAGEDSVLDALMRGGEAAVRTGVPATAERAARTPRHPPPKAPRPMPDRPPPKGAGPPAATAADGDPVHGVDAAEDGESGASPSPRHHPTATWASTCSSPSERAMMAAPHESL